MKTEIRNILIVTLSNMNSTVTYDRSIFIEDKNFILSEIVVDNFSEGYSEFLRADYSYLVILKPDRWKNKLVTINPYIIACISSLENNEHYAICQPSIIYGNLLEEHINISLQRKSHSYVKYLDDAFIFVKGIVAKNFDLNQCIIKERVNWNLYKDEINLYGFESYRLCTCYLEVELDKEIQLRITSPSDCIDLLNMSYMRNIYDIGIEFSSLSPVFNGTSEYAVNILPKMVEIFKKNQITFQIIADLSIIEKFKLEEYIDYIVAPLKSEENFYKLLFIPQQVYSELALEKINRICFKFVFTMLDVIALRCKYLSELHRLDVASSLAYKYSDQVLGISKTSSNDIEAFFNERMIYKTVTPILLTKNLSNLDFKMDEMEFEEKNYVLLIGNGYKHKAVEKVLNQLIDYELNLVVIADEGVSGKFGNRFKIYVSGQLSRQMVDLLYDKSSLILYPSLYEGFGLPVIAALQLGKRILVFDSDINRELKTQFDTNNLIYFFDSFSGLNAKISSFLNLPQEAKSNYSVSRTWSDVSEETVKILIDNLNSPLDFDMLNQRTYDIISSEISEIIEFKKQISLKDQTIANLVNSIPWKIGQFILWPLRKLRQFVFIFR